MRDEQRFDVIVVGGGIAGLIAANRAAQFNLKAVVLECGEVDKYLCNTRFTGGTLHICMREITLDEETLRQTILESGGDFIAPDIAQVIAREGRRVVRWLQDEGMRFMRASASEYHKWVLAPPGRSRPGLDWEGRAGDVLLRTLEERLHDRGGRVVRGSRARTLVMDGARCVGVLAQQGGGEITYSAGAVFIADGGFSGNAGLVGRYISRQPERLKQRGAGTGKGDGLCMAEAAGAALVGMDRFYGHMLSIDAMKNDRLWPYPYLDSLVTAGIVVDASGRRFVDEGRGGVYVANAVAALDDPQSAQVIFDQAIWDKAGRNGLIAANPHAEREGATMHRADTLDALAVLARVPAEALKRTILQYNESVFGKEQPGALSPPRYGKKHDPFPILKGPFYALPMCVGITYTMGGVRVNAHAQAMRRDGSPIEGLYALGSAAGGIEGGPNVAYVGGLAKAGVTALVAAEHFAAAMA